MEIIQGHYFNVLRLYYLNQMTIKSSIKSVMIIIISIKPSFFHHSYVLPPPSRPRTWAIPAGPYAPPNYNNLPPKGNNYGQLASNSYSGGVTSVPGLAAQYVPGVGIKYTAIVSDKLQGKYNAKTKKYKAYEKAKYAYPWNYVRQYENRKRYLRY